MREQTLAVQRMQDYIEQNKTMEITLSDLAKVSLFSPCIPTVCSGTIWG